MNKIPLLTEELSDDEMIGVVETAASAINPLRVEDDAAADMKEDDMSEDLSVSENSDIDDDIRD